MSGERVKTSVVANHWRDDPVTTARRTSEKCASGSEDASAVFIERLGKRNEGLSIDLVERLSAISGEVRRPDRS
jgi:hypothetical protein